MTYNPGKKSLGHLSKCQLFMHYFKVEVIIQFFQAPFPSKAMMENSGSSLDESSSTLCLGQGGASREVDRNTISRQKVQCFHIVKKTGGENEATIINSKGKLSWCNTKYSEQHYTNLKNISTQSVRELFFGDRSIRRTVHSNDLLKFFGGLRCTARRKLEIYNL